MNAKTLRRQLLATSLLASSLVALRPAQAQDAASSPPSSAGPMAPAASNGKDNAEIIVTGTRTVGMKASDSPAPIQVLGSDLIARTGNPGLVQTLSDNVPSFTAQVFGSGVSNLVKSAQLDGVSPNDTLVLVNGKRRHFTSTLSLSSYNFTGASGADLSLIPAASIARIEVLQDGAAAQYGSDAIAGVINVIQKTTNHGGSISATGGRYFDQGGQTADLSANFGFAPVPNGYLNLTGEVKHHDYSFRGDVDPRTIDTPYNKGAVTSPARSYPQIVEAPDYPYLNRFPGDSKYLLGLVSYDAGYEASDTIKIYSFGGYSYRDATANNVYRTPNVVVGKSATDVPFPYGFQPLEELKEHDFQTTLGVKGVLAGWNWDLSSSYGQNSDSLYVDHSANASLYYDTSTATTAGTSPSRFLEGTFLNAEWSNNLDVTRDIDVGLAKPITLALGGEYRDDRYRIGAGDPASYYKGGSESFFGFAPINAGTHRRSDVAVYADVALSPVEKWKIDVAGRYSHYSDFGGTAIGKLTTRYDFSPAFAIRGTFSTGFRAPTLAEEYYSGINVTPANISGQLAPNSAGAKLLGLDGLKPEKSTNYSFGFVAHPLPRMTLTFDAYQISIKHRIVASGTVYGDASNKALVRSPAVLAALEANGVNIDPTIFLNSSWSIGVSLLANGLDTRTRGFDAVLTYNTDLGSWGHVDWTLAANYSQNKVTSIDGPPSGLAAGAVLYDKTAISNLTTAAPLYKIVAGAHWTRDDLSVNLRETLYGTAKNANLDTFGTPTYLENVIKPKVITDLEVDYELTKHLNFAIGANNLFDIYPNKFNALLRQHWLQQTSSNYANKYIPISPYGINGGYYYGRITYSF